MTSALSTQSVDAAISTISTWTPQGLTGANYPSAAHAAQQIVAMTAAGCPDADWTTFATFGLSHSTWLHKRFPHRLELVAALPAGQGDMGHALASVAHHCAHEDILPRHWLLLPDVARACNAGPWVAQLPHLLIVDPYMWGPAFKEVKMAEATIWFMQCVPLYDDEGRYCDSKGVPAFLERAEIKETHLADPDA